MPPKKADKDAKAEKAPKVAKVGGGGKQKKKKWSKGKVRDKLANLVIFDQATYDKMLKEVVNSKVITPATMSDRLKINGSLARRAIRDLANQGLIRPVSNHSALPIYTRNTKT